MKCRICGNETFYGHQTVHVDIICDGDGEFIENANGSMGASTYEADSSFGPFTCTCCGAVYDELRDGEALADFSVLYAPIKDQPGQLAVIDSFLTTTGDGFVTVEPSPLKAERFAPGCCKPISALEIQMAIADHRIVRSWLVADAADMQTVAEHALIQRDELDQKETVIHPVTGETIHIEMAEAKYGFCNYVDHCGKPQDFVLLGLPEKAGGDSAFLGVPALCCAYGVPVEAGKTFACGEPVLLVWSSQTEYESGTFPMVVEISKREG